MYALDGCGTTNPNATGSSSISCDMIIITTAAMAPTEILRPPLLLMVAASSLSSLRQCCCLLKNIFHRIYIPHPPKTDATTAVATAL
jgi:hypothetical protein